MLELVSTDFVLENPWLYDAKQFISLDKNAYNLQYLIMPIAMSHVLQL